MSSPRIAALDVGGTNLKACLFFDGKPYKVIETPSKAALGATHMFEQIIAVLEKLLPFDAIGVSSAGQVDHKSGVIRYANDNIPGYTGTDVRGILSEHFHVPIVVINDAYAAAIGEGSHGAAKGELNYLCLTYGTGIGGGVILNGVPYYGAGASANVMLGGLILHPEKVCMDDPFSGSYERFASTSALVRMGMMVDPSLDNGRAIFSRLNELKIKAIVDCWLDEVVAGICSFIHIYNVPLIVLGGGIMEQPYTINCVRTRTIEKLIPGFHTPRIENARLGNMAGLYGAAEMAKNIM